jgi:hypothetical protein
MKDKCLSCGKEVIELVNLNYSKEERDLIYKSLTKPKDEKLLGKKIDKPQNIEKEVVKKQKIC